jgi:hypothetical protein
MYRMVFGITDIKGSHPNDFKFIPNKSVTAQDIKEATDAAADEDINRCGCKLSGWVSA